jgi:hypothetical protein
MTTKTTNTTNNAGVPPAPPEAHHRAGVNRINRSDVIALAAMLKNPAPTIRKAAAEMLAQLRAGGIELAF